MVGGGKAWARFGRGVRRSKVVETLKPARNHSPDRGRLPIVSTRRNPILFGGADIYLGHPEVRQTGGGGGGG